MDALWFALFLGGLALGGAALAWVLNRYGSGGAGHGGGLGSL